MDAIARLDIYSSHAIWSRLRVSSSPDWVERSRRAPVLLAALAGALHMIYTCRTPYETKFFVVSNRENETNNRQRVSRR
jgi:hypothetical protein